MHQVLQNIGNGKLGISAVPEPVARAGHVLIANACSLISAGTEKMVMDLAKKSLLGKARERPDHVRRVLEKIRNEGFFTTLQQVREKLDESIALGYSSAGVVLACGADVQEFKPGDRAASNGPHAGVVCIPKHLCARVPENVSSEHAAFTVLGAIAMQGVRLSRLGLGDTALVIGLGLVGQLTVALLKASGVRVLCTDLDPAKCELARKMGAEHSAPDLNAKTVASFTLGLGADAVLIAASTKSDGPVELAGESVRQKGRVVAIGAVGLNLPRRPYYFKEAEFVVSCSYGPGRYDPEYEERGRDYPAAYVRWTEQRNMQAVLELISSGKIDLAPLISHRFSIEKAEQAYAMIESGSQPYLGIVLQYPEYSEVRAKRRLELKVAKAAGAIGVGCLGAGNFARSVLLPALKKSGSFRPRVICSASGVSAAKAAEKFGFEMVSADEDDVFKDSDVQAVFALTRHDRHADQVLKALRAGKHVFVEKPLGLTVDEIEAIDAALSSASPRPLVMCGFNRRFSPAAGAVKQFFQDVTSPRTISVRFNAGEIPPEHWTQDENVGGGRIIGEACHAIDLATFLAGSPPVRVFAESVGGRQAPKITDDQCFITLRHANGSISNVAYVSSGDKAFPKERVEVFGGGRVAVIDDFRSVTTCSGGREKTIDGWKQDKGHAVEIEAFAQALTKGGAAPISWEELRSVSLAAILAVQSLREGCAFDLP